MLGAPSAETVPIPPPPLAAPATGMRIARKLGMMTYRSAHEWIERFGREPVRDDLREDGPFAPEFAIQGYLESHARRFVRKGINAQCKSGDDRDWVALQSTEEVLNGLFSIV